MTLDEKLRYLDALHASHGLFQVAQLAKRDDGTLSCSMHWPWEVVRGHQLKQLVVNVRSMTSDELVLDYESQEQAYAGLELLDRDKVRYSVWETGSRGFHAHAYYGEFARCSDNFKQAVRGVLILRYKADIAKKSGLVALEYAPHFKTGREKRLQIPAAKGHNFLGSELRRHVERLIQQTPRRKPDAYLLQLYQKLSPQLLFGGLPGWRKVGKTYMAICPFHHDTSPSFAVPAKGYYFHCFGCGAKGDWLKYLMLKDGLTYYEARSKLEDMAAVRQT